MTLTTHDATATGQMVQLVRVARGLTQAQLAERTSVSQAVLSKVEGGVVRLDEDRLGVVAEQLGVPMARLTTGEPTGGFLSACAFHRKRNSLPVSDAKRIRADLDLRRMQIEACGIPRHAPRSDCPTRAELRVRAATAAP